MKDLSKYVREVYDKIMEEKSDKNVTKDCVDGIIEQLAERVRNVDNSVKITLEEVFFEGFEFNLMAKINVEILDWYEGFPTTVTNFYLDLPVLPFAKEK